MQNDLRDKPHPERNGLLKKIQSVFDSALGACSTNEQLEFILKQVKSINSTVIAMNASSGVNLTPVCKKRGMVETQNRFHSTKKRKQLHSNPTSVSYPMTLLEKEEVSAAIVLSNLEGE